MYTKLHEDNEEKVELRREIDKLRRLGFSNIENTLTLKKIKRFSISKRSSRIKMRMKSIPYIERTVCITFTQ